MTKRVSTGIPAPCPGLTAAKWEHMAIREEVPKGLGDAEVAARARPEARPGGRQGRRLCRDVASLRAISHREDPVLLVAAFIHSFIHSTSVH